MTKIISLSNHKGGVGKSCSTANIGAFLHKSKKKVLLIDLDPQANLSLGFGIKNAEMGIYEVLMGKCLIKETIVSVKENFDLVPSHLGLCGAEIELSSESGREFILRDVLSAIKGKYDYILIDCPPSLGLLTLNALTCSDEVLIPLQAQYLAMQGVSKLAEVIQKIQTRLNPRLNILGIFLTQYDNRKILNRDVAKTVENNFKVKVFKAKIRNNIALAEAPYHGKDIFDYAPESIGAQDYVTLTKEILAKDKK